MPEANGADVSAALVQTRLVHALSLYSLKTTLPVAAGGFRVAVSDSVAVQVIVPDDDVDTVTSWFAIVRTQSDGSELGSCDGYEHVLSRFALLRAERPRAFAMAVISHVACVSAESNGPDTELVIVQ